MMGKRNFLLVFLCAALIWLISSCQKEDNSQSQIDLSVIADSTSFALQTTNNAPPGNIEFQSGNLTVSSFEFDAVVEKAATKNISKGPFLLDLFSANPDVYTIPLNRGFYNSVQIKVSIIKGAAVPAPLVLIGKYTNATGTVTPVELDFNENTDIILKIKDQLVTDQFTGYSASLRLYFSRLFKNIVTTDLDKASRTNGTIMLTPTLNKNIYAKIKTNIISSLGGDVNEVDVNDN